MQEIIKSNIENQEWYQNLVDAGRKGYRTRTRMEIVEGYHELGKRIQTDMNFKKYAKGRGEAINKLAKDIRLTDATIYYTIQFYEQYPDLEIFPKNISWNKIKTKYLRKAKNLPLTTKEILKEEEHIEKPKMARRIKKGLDYFPRWHPQMSTLRKFDSKDFRVRYDALRDSSSNFISRKDVKDAIYKMHNKKCVICGGENNLCIDHIISIWRVANGEYPVKLLNSKENFQILCVNCNSGKSP